MGFFKNLAVFFIFITALIITAGCDLDLGLDDSGDSLEAATEYQWDGNILYAYEGDTLIWYEVYEGGSPAPSDSPKQIQHFLPSDEQLWTKRYAYEDGEVTLMAYYSGSSTTADWCVDYVYDSGKLIQEITWDFQGSGTSATTVLEEFYAYGYTPADEYDHIYRFSGTNILNTAWEYEYNGGLLSRIDMFEGTGGLNGSLSGYTTYQYDGSDRPLTYTGYGNMSYGGFESDCKDESKQIRYIFSASAGVSRALLTMPSVPSPPVIPALTLSDSPTIALSWRASWVWDDTFSGSAENFSAVLQNNEDLPTILYRHYMSGGESENIQIDLSYGPGDRIEEKTVSVNGVEALSIDFNYTSNGSLSEVACSGEVMPLPAALSVVYNSNNLPSQLQLSSGDTVLRTLTYSYKNINLSTVTKDDFAQAIASISERNGDNVLIANYTFSYNNTENELVITVTDSSAKITGQYIVYYNAEGLNAGMACYSSDDNGNSYDAQWSYRYSYNDAEKRVREFKEDLTGLFNNVDQQDIDNYSIDDLQGVPQINEAYGIDIETFIEDIRNYMPF